MNNQRQAGFTLIELMIVVAIIAVLAAIALPAYQDYTIRTQVTEGISVAGGARAAVWEYSSTKGILPTSNPSAGLPSAASISGRYVSGVEIIPSGEVEVTFGKQANDRIQGETMRFEPVLGGTSEAVNWLCTGGTLQPKYRSTRCRAP